jgi:DNA-directed RNA polymerase specialized sigma24 family protein
VRDDGEFVAFVETSGSRLCETAFLLCRDWNFAQDLTQITFIKVYLSWRRIRPDDPYRYSNKVLLRAYLDHKRLKSSAELQTDALPDRPAVADAAELRLTPARTRDPGTRYLSRARSVVQLPVHRLLACTRLSWMLM